MTETKIQTRKEPEVDIESLIVSFGPRMAVALCAIGDRLHAPGLDEDTALVSREMLFGINNLLHELKGDFQGIHDWCHWSFGELNELSRLQKLHRPELHELADLLDEHASRIEVLQLIEKYREKEERFRQQEDPDLD